MGLPTATYCADVIRDVHSRGFVPPAEADVDGIFTLLRVSLNQTVPPYLLVVEIASLAGACDPGMAEFPWEVLRELYKAQIRHLIEQWATPYDRENAVERFERLLSGPPPARYRCG